MGRLNPSPTNVARISGHGLAGAPDGLVTPPETHVSCRHRGGPGRSSISGRTARRRGASLVEICVGALILAIVVIPSLLVISGELRTVIGTREHQHAAEVARQVIESARTCHFEQLDRFVAEQANRVVTIDQIDYHLDGLRLDAVQSTDPPGRTVAHRLVFSVRFRGREGRTLQLDVATLIGRGDG